MRPIACLLGRHSEVVGYHRDGTLIHYMAVCSRCKRARPAGDAAHPQALRIPTRRERREIARRQRRGEQDAQMLLKSLDRSAPKETTDG